MVTANYEKVVKKIEVGSKIKEIKYCEGTCLSLDTKPTDWENGSKLLEIDTSKLYIYDAQNKIWREW